MCWPEWHSETRPIMGTEVSVTLWHEDEDKASQAIEAAMALMQSVDDRWNPEDPGTELYGVNSEAPGQSVAISLELTRIVDKALYYSRLSDGAFDVSFASVGRYYDYRAGAAPDDQQLETALPAVNYRLLQLDRKAQSLHFEHPDMRIDLGGIAKGYAVDLAIDLLHQRGVMHASVSAGGDTRLLGDRRGRPWMVGIRNPRKQGDVAMVLPLQDVAVSTSGDYERFFIDEISGERIHHIINPRTGHSAGGIVSASVIGPLGFDTDPLSTTVFVLGIEKGLALINALPDFDAVIIAADGRVHYSSGLVE
jgi:thiamine biosynthesis lipoprotein